MRQAVEVCGRRCGRVRYNGLQCRAHGAYARMSRYGSATRRQSVVQRGWRCSPTVATQRFVAAAALQGCCSARAGANVEVPEVCVAFMCREGELQVVR